jgi:hypothetical protein
MNDSNDDTYRGENVRKRFRRKRDERRRRKKRRGRDGEREREREEEEEGILKYESALHLPTFFQSSSRV